MTRTPPSLPLGRSQTTAQVSSLLPVVLVGCGGHASDVLSVIEACNDALERYRVIGYLDDDANADDHRLRSRGVTRIGCIEDAGLVEGYFALGVGYPEPRARVAARLWAIGQPIEALVHPHASLASEVALNPAVVIFGGVHVGPLARMSTGVMVGRAAVIGHDTRIGEYVSVMPGAVVGGDCRIGAGAMIGSNATILEGRTVGEWSQLGAGAVLTDDLPPNCTAVGVPARVIEAIR